MKNLDLKVKTTDLFFYLAYGSFIIWSYKNITPLNDFLPKKLFVLLGILVVFFSGISIYKKAGTYKYYICSLVFLIYGGILYFTTANSLIFIVILIALASYKVEFDNICKITLYLNLIMSIFTIVLCLLGKIPNYLYVSPIRRDSQGNMISAYSYGFLHYSSASFIALFLSIIYLYINRNNLKLRNVICIAIINICIYFLFTTRMPLIVCLFVLIMTLCFKYKVFHFEKKIWLYIGTVLPLVLAIGSFIIVYMYSNYKTPALETINQHLFNDRLKQASHTLEIYDVPLFGQKMVMYGSYMIRYGGADISEQEYVFVDNGYIFSFLQYGFVFTVFILFVYIKAIRYASMSNNTALYIWIIAILLFSVINSSLLNIEYNPCLILGINIFLQDLSDFYKNRKEDKDEFHYV